MFKLQSNYKPCGDQPEAVKQLSQGVLQNKKFQVLLGVTGSGKTFTMANVIQKVNKPTLVISHNKTLAAQLYSELHSLFPKNRVEYFVSYYDYYQPEAYIPSTDTYIEKDTSINEEIDKLRLRATSSLMETRDVIIVASVSCIYGLGSPKDFRELLLFLEKDQTFKRRDILQRLVNIHYSRNDVDFKRGTFRVRGDVIDIFPAYGEQPIRIELWGDTIDSIAIINQVTGQIIEEKKKVAVYPAIHFVTTETKLNTAITNIEKELEERLTYFRSKGKLLEAQRLESRTKYDIEMMQEIGFCSGIENYSRHLAGREPGSRPACLIDYFPDDFLVIIDESHVTIPQIRGMYNGDRARKEVLVEHGFRLPSALDNRPLKFDEFESLVKQVIFVSATPADYEYEKTGGEVVEQIIRPTGLMDPEIELRPVSGQIDDLIGEIRKRVRKKERVLVTTLTKRMAEDLADYLSDLNIRVRYLHSEVETFERVKIIRGLRLAEFDVLVGINLLREGLDLPEVSLVAILDADKEGFLRSERSLMQIAGRAARNVSGKVLLYADKETKSIRRIVNETKRRRKIQKEYNIKYGIEPETIHKSPEEILSSTSIAEAGKVKTVAERNIDALTLVQKEELIASLEIKMKAAARKLEFEQAAELRDEIEMLSNSLVKE